MLTGGVGERLWLCPALDLNLEGWLAEHLRDAFDSIHGGFGRAAKRIQEAPIRFVLARCHGGDGSIRDVAIRTLDAIGWSPLFDDVEGGVFRFAERRDWCQPHVEKLLRQTITPFALNCRVAHLLARLSRDGEQANFR